MLIWLFGPLGTLKINFNTSYIFDRQKLIIFFFDYPLINYKKKNSLIASTSNTFHTAILNLTRGYRTFVRIRGVGYRLELLANNLVAHLGFSHPIIIKIPIYIKICILKKRIVLWSYSFCKLQQFCYKLYLLKGKDVYTGKGILQPHLQKKLKIGKLTRT